MTTATRKPATAGSLQAGDRIAESEIETAAASLADLLAPRSVADADAALAMIETRRAAADAALSAHAGTRDDALLAGTESRHDAEARRLADDARRLCVAAERVSTRRDELAAAERLAEGENAADKARELVAVIEGRLAEYVVAAKRVAALLAEIESLQGQLIDARAIARDAGVACDAPLPHEARFRRPQYEDREVVSRQRPAGVYIGGRRVGENGDAEDIVSRTVERVLVDTGHRVPDVTIARAVLPSPDGGRLLDRGED